MTCSCSLGCKVEPVLFCLLIGISPSSVSFPSLLVGVLQRNRANMMCVSRQIYYKELVIPCIQLWKLASPESAGWAGRLRTQESRCSGLSPKAAHDTGPKTICWRFFSCSLFILFKPSTDRMRLTHVVVGNCLPSKFTDLHESQPKVPSQKHPE